MRLSSMQNNIEIVFLLINKSRSSLVYKNWGSLPFSKILGWSFELGQWGGGAWLYADESGHMPEERGNEEHSYLLEAGSYNYMQWSMVIRQNDFSGQCFCKGSAHTLLIPIICNIYFLSIETINQSVINLIIIFL